MIGSARQRRLPATPTTPVISPATSPTSLPHGRSAAIATAAAPARPRARLAAALRWSNETVDFTPLKHCLKYFGSKNDPNAAQGAVEEVLERMIADFVQARPQLVQPFTPYDIDAIRGTAAPSVLCCGLAGRPATRTLKEALEHYGQKYGFAPPVWQGWQLFAASYLLQLQRSLAAAQRPSPPAPQKPSPAPPQCPRQPAPSSPRQPEREPHKPSVARIFNPRHARPAAATVTTDLWRQQRLPPTLAVRFSVQLTQADGTCALHALLGQPTPLVDETGDRVVGLCAGEPAWVRQMAAVQVMRQLELGPQEATGPGAQTLRQFRQVLKEHLDYLMHADQAAPASGTTEARARQAFFAAVPRLQTDLKHLRKIAQHEARVPPGPDRNVIIAALRRDAEEILNSLARDPQVQQAYVNTFFKDFLDYYFSEEELGLLAHAYNKRVRLHPLQTPHAEADDKHFTYYGSLERDAELPPPIRDFNPQAGGEVVEIIVAAHHYCRLAVKERLA